MELTSLKGIGEALAEKFIQLGITDVEDLLTTYPRTYLDYSTVVSIAQLNADTPQTFKAKVKSVKNIFLRKQRGKTLQQAVLEDSSGKISATWFNMPFLVDSLILGEEYYFVGKLRIDKRGNPQVSTATFEKAGANGETLHTARIVPVYSLTRGLSPKVYRRTLKNALAHADLLVSSKTAKVFEEHYKAEELHQLILETGPDYELNWPILDYQNALSEIHFPSNETELRKAKLRLSIDELLPIQLKLLRRQRARAKAKARVVLKGAAAEKLLANYWQSQPFEPTEGQTAVTRELLQDYTAGRPAYRLIQGDVGTGKTAVAGFAAAAALEAGLDAVLLAPTTILANQHAESFRRTFGKQAMILTSNDQEARERLSFFSKNGNTGRKPAFIIATQALLHHYQEMGLNIGVVIVDEEHRFGVKQREAIAGLWGTQSASNSQQGLPHYYSLTATPIPRTLALSIFGDIDLSRLTTPPANRKPKLTYMVPESKRTDSYAWLREHLEKGEKIFWVCPLIEKRAELDDMPVLLPANEKSTLKDKVEELKGLYPEYKIGQLHGKLKAESKQRALADFAANKTQILVATTVIEVGIDIPDANLIVIESADTFGLAQLHQLRGRVGRGAGQGICLVYGDSERLRTFAHETDGLKLAEYDLSQRGPGEVYGKMQSGIPNLQLASLTDPLQLKASRIVAEKIFGV